MTGRVVWLWLAFSAAFVALGVGLLWLGTVLDLEPTGAGEGSRLTQATRIATLFGAVSGLFLVPMLVAFAIDQWLRERTLSPLFPSFFLFTASILAIVVVLALRALDRWRNGQPGAWTALYEPEVNLAITWLYIAPSRRPRSRAA